LTILVPKFLTTRNHAEVIAFCRRVTDAEESVVDLDARHLVFVDPFALTLLGATLHEVKAYHQHIRVSGLSPDVGGYLQRMDVFDDVEFVGGAPPVGQRHDRRDSLVELTRIDNRGQAPDAARRTAQALVGATPAGDSPAGDPTMDDASPADRLLKLIHYVLSELLENAVVHGQRRGFRGRCHVWIAAQYYPLNDMVRLAVTDTGCGFLATLRGHPDLGVETHFSAILTAMKPRVSCNRDLGVATNTVNQGVGLTTVTRIVRLAQGHTLIVSGDSYHKPPGSGGRSGDAAFWQGVVVAMEMRRGRLQTVRIRDALPHLVTGPKVSPRFE